MFLRVILPWGLSQNGELLLLSLQLRFPDYQWHGAQVLTGISAYLITFSNYTSTLTNSSNHFYPTSCSFLPWGRYDTNR